MAFDKAKYMEKVMENMRKVAMQHGVRIEQVAVRFAEAKEGEPPDYKIEVKPTQQ